MGGGVGVGEGGLITFLTLKQSPPNLANFSKNYMETICRRDFSKF